MTVFKRWPQILLSLVSGVLSRVALAAGALPHSTASTNPFQNKTTMIVFVVAAVIVSYFLIFKPVKKAEKELKNLNKQDK